MAHRIKVGRTESLGDFNNIRVDVELEVPNEDLIESAIREARQHVEATIDDALEENGHPAKYDECDRYTIITHRRLGIELIVADGVRPSDIPGKENEWTIPTHNGYLAHHHRKEYLWNKYPDAVEISKGAESEVARLMFLRGYIAVIFNDRSDEGTLIKSNDELRSHAFTDGEFMLRFFKSEDEFRKWLGDELPF